jgi:hypothetical protein
MSVPAYGYLVNNKAPVALVRALRNPRKRVMGVDWEWKLTFGFSNSAAVAGALLVDGDVKPSTRENAN